MSIIAVARVFVIGRKGDLAIPQKWDLESSTQPQTAKENPMKAIVYHKCGSSDVLELEEAFQF